MVLFILFVIKINLLLFRFIVYHQEHIPCGAICGRILVIMQILYIKKQMVKYGQIRHLKQSSKFYCDVDCQRTREHSWTNNFSCHNDLWLALWFFIIIIFLFSCVRFWRAMYNRFDNDVHPRETLVDSLSSIIDHNDSLRDHIKLLNKVYYPLWQGIFILD